MPRLTIEETAALLRDAEPPRVLDVRSDAEFAAGHWPGSGHVPLDELAERRPELPPRHRRVLVVASSGADAQRAADHLATMDFAEVLWFDGGASALPIAHDTSEARQLWEPNQFLASRIDTIPAGKALDVASGSGRDAVFLALHGFDTQAWDHDAFALTRASAMARRHGVALTTVECDLEARGFRFPESAFGLIVCVRFLHRPLFPAMGRALAPGGHLVYETYRRGQELRGRPRRPRFLLEAGELRTAFAGLEVLAYEEPSPDTGPLTSRLHARRAD